MRSSMPPWPGKTAPLSLAPTWRLSMLMERSPKKASTPHSRPVKTPTAGVMAMGMAQASSPPAIPAAAQPLMVPSHVFLGLSRGQMRRRPQSTPTK